MISIKFPSLGLLVSVLFLFFAVYSLYSGKLYQIYSIMDIDKQHVRSGVDFNMYTVRDSPDHKRNLEVANRLATINREINRLVDYMDVKKLPNKIVSKRLVSRWAGCKLKEMSEDNSVIAFTISKGESIHLCVRDQDQNLYDYNTGMFVVLHELAHLMSVSSGHEEEFNINFNTILDIAAKIGVYNKIDPKDGQKTYCGTNIF